MASTESLNRPVASSLGDAISGNESRWLRSNDILPRQLQPPRYDGVPRIVRATISDLEINRFLVTLDDKFRCLVKLACESNNVIGAGVFPARKFSWFELPLIENNKMNKLLTFQQSLGAACDKDRSL